MRDNCPMTLMSCSLHCSDLLFDIRLVTLENAWRRELKDKRNGARNNALTWSLD